MSAVPNPRILFLMKPNWTGYKGKVRKEIIVKIKMNPFSNPGILCPNETQFEFSCGEHK